MPKNKLDGFVVSDEEEEEKSFSGGSDGEESDAVSSQGEKQPAQKKQKTTPKKERKKSKEFVSEEEDGGDEDGSESESIGQKNEQGETFFSLGGSRRLTVRKWKNSILVDIREFWKDKDGSEKPGKKGISLSSEQWKTLAGLAGKVDQAVSKA